MAPQLAKKCLLGLFVCLFVCLFGTEAFCLPGIQMSLLATAVASREATKMPAEGTIKWQNPHPER